MSEISLPSRFRSVLWHWSQRLRHPLTVNPNERMLGLCLYGCGDAETRCPGCCSIQCLNCAPCECGEAYGRLGP